MSELSLRDIAKQVSCSNMQALAKKHADHNRELMHQHFSISGCNHNAYNVDEKDERHVGYIPSQIVTYKDCPERRDNDMEWWDQQFFRHVPQTMNISTRMKISTKK